MEKRFAVRIPISITRQEEERFYCSEKHHAIPVLLKDIAYGGRRFHIESVGKYQAVLFGSCTKQEIADLHEELALYFELGMWMDDSEREHWRIEVGEEVPTENYVKEDGELPIQAAVCSLTFAEDWAKEQSEPPTEVFLRLLSKELCWKNCEGFKSALNPLVCTVAHVHFTTMFEQSVSRLWDKCNQILQEMSADRFVIELDVTERVIMPISKYGRDE